MGGNGGMVTGESRNHFQVLSKGGIFDSDLGVVACPEADVDPFLEADARMEMQSLIDACW